MSANTTKDELDRLQRSCHAAYEAWASCPPGRMEMERSLWLAYHSARQAYDWARQSADPAHGHGAGGLRHA